MKIKDFQDAWKQSFQHRKCKAFSCAENALHFRAKAKNQ